MAADKGGSGEGETSDRAKHEAILARCGLRSSADLIRMTGLGIVLIFSDMVKDLYD